MGILVELAETLSGEGANGLKASQFLDRVLYSDSSPNEMYYLFARAYARERGISLKAANVKRYAAAYIKLVLDNTIDRRQAIALINTARENDGWPVIQGWRVKK